LLIRPDARTITIPADVSYRRAMTYRAVPLIALIGDVGKLGFTTIEARAKDGFVSQIPVSLIMQGVGRLRRVDRDRRAEGAVAEPAGQASERGPFYLVWENPERSSVGSEQWPYALAGLTGVDDPVRRWPQLAVDLPCERRQGTSWAGIVHQELHSLPSPQRRGRKRDRPDLGKPMNVMTYMTAVGLHALIRDPKSVRTWPEQQMLGFGPEIPDAEIDALIAFLAYSAKR
jgi:hypothetical protein